MATTRIQITAADNEVLLIASTPAGSSELFHYKSGYGRQVDVTLYPGAVLPTGSYALTMIGINWGGPSAYTITVTTDGMPRTFSGGGNSNIGVNWTNTIPIDIVSGQ